MDNEKNTSTKYPQKIYDLLVDPEFREYLKLTYQEHNGDKELFYNEIIELGTKTKEYIEILYSVAFNEANLISENLK